MFLLKKVLLNGKEQDILINGNQICRIDDDIENDEAEVIVCQNKAILPSFCNTHTHASMMFLRGIGEDKELFSWLNEDIWPREAKLTPEMIYHLSRFALLEMIKTGTTLFADMYFYPQETIRAVQDMGIRGAVSFLGMDFFNAINHAFSTVATGGFSTLNDSVKGFDSVLIEYIILFFMFVSGLHFGLIYSSVTERSLKIFRSPVVKYYIACVLLFSVAIAVNLLAAKVETNWGEAISHSLFQVVSVSTSTGFATSEISVWPNFAMLLMLFLMIQGACSGSTTGGVKADRFLIFFKSIKAQLKKYVHPNAVMPVKVGKHTVDYDLVSSVNLFILFYFLILFAGTVLLTIFGVGMEDAVSSVISNMGNVGVAFGDIGSFGNYNYFPAAAKFVLSLLMLVGRFEIFSFIVILVIYKWR